MTKKRRFLSSLDKVLDKAGSRFLNHQYSKATERYKIFFPWVEYEEFECFLFFFSIAEKKVNSLSDEIFGQHVQTNTEKYNTNDGWGEKCNQRNITICTNVTRVT